MLQSDIMSLFIGNVTDNVTGNLQSVILLWTDITIRYI